MTFGVSGSAASSKSQSTSYGYQGSASVSESTGTSKAGSTGFAQAASSQDIAFVDLFSQLYGGAAMAGASITGAPIKSAADMLFSGGTGFLESLQSGGAGGQYLQNRVTGENSILQEQIGALGQDLGQFFREELNPAITGQSVAGGQLGGGRQGVAQTGAAGEVAQQFARGSTALRSADQAARDAAARDLMAQQTGAAGVGLASLPALFGIAQGGALADFAPFKALAEIMGGPTTLTESQSTQVSESFATSEQVAKAVSAAFGEESSQSTSSSKAKSGGIGF